MNPYNNLQMLEDWYSQYSNKNRLADIARPQQFSYTNESFQQPQYPQSYQQQPQPQNYQQSYPVAYPRRLNNVYMEYQGNIVPARDFVNSENARTFGSFRNW